jgi:hypothetical protein
MGDRGRWDGYNAYLFIGNKSLLNMDCSSLNSVVMSQSDLVIQVLFAVPGKAVTNDEFEKGSV